MAKYVMIIWLN